MDNFTQICPRCAGTDIHIDFSNHAQWAYGAPTNYQCFTCGHTGNFFPEIEKTFVQRFSARVHHGKSEIFSLNFSHGYIGTMAKIFGPIFLIFSLILFYNYEYAIGLMEFLYGFFLFYLAYLRK